VLVFALLALTTVVALSAAISIRILRLAARNHQLPELLIGVFFASISIELADYGQRLLALSEIDLRPVLFCISVGSLLLFDWLVFRPAAIWAGALTCIVLAAVLAASSLHFAAGEASVGIRMVWGLGRAISLGWAFGESFRYWRLMRKRLAIGTGDPIVANRFGLWAIWTGAIAILPIAGLVTRLLALAGGGTEPWETGSRIVFTPALAVFAALVLAFVAVAGAALWQSFFPTGSHLARVQARAEARENQGAGFAAA
jgi:hypothetical protein